MNISRHVNHPTHIYIDNTNYFISAAIFEHKKLLSDNLKSLLVKLFHEVFAEYEWSLDAWVVLDNHYHLLCKSKRGKDMSRIIAKIHNQSAQAIKAEHSINTKVWANYWDYCLRNDKEYHVRLCYLLNNPYKHGYVSDLHDWEWSSFHKYYEDLGGKQLRKQFHEHSDYRNLDLEGTVD
ncbi:MAG: Unknown protein [uncultured Thiotrichaceae bacterium]|uniref:Transposase IS200-like domain-containing protein n=1 Tax=uncultured Thiotrichaceae bacterium TaxID=298394 RepID=A0A6S6UDN9_9GAMM|nr:MAG: Unknown protein [uncultured Thiotrichaceae bacterium]